MPPEAFIERPMRWLEAISKHGGTITAAPNFAYQLAVDLSSPEERAALDLSTMLTAMCGAEPIRAGTLQRFIDTFAPAGFQPRGFAPVYGMAESTLLVSGKADRVAPVVRYPRQRRAARSPHRPRRTGIARRSVVRGVRSSPARP